MKIQDVAAGFTVSPQLGPADFPVLAARGIRLVINNRPDGEAEGQLPAKQAAQLAEENGMAYRHIPITFASLSADDVSAFAGAVAGAVGPVHAHCRSGQRSATLWALHAVTSGDLPREEASAKLLALGFDPNPALTWLDRQPSARNS
ncbi:TIGR01244 family sulfur transferase [Acidisoma sp. S159]|uniref:TIGR01244 family sulfur transferase n=1 Tax=Acidisoma sp. S159 TaxID=1747225 RepID=UPI00131DAEB2|nr:TIGR01244 family sulfur transferase [Acidisoma sp. S159]